MLNARSICWVMLSLHFWHRSTFSLDASMKYMTSDAILSINTRTTWGLLKSIFLVWKKSAKYDRLISRSDELFRILKYHIIKIFFTTKHNQNRSSFRKYKMHSLTKISKEFNLMNLCLFYQHSIDYMKFLKCL